MTTPSTGAVSHDRHADLLRRAPFAFLECDAAGRVQGWNEGAARLFGFAAEEALGRPLGELIPPVGEPDGWARWLRGGEETVRWAHARKAGGAAVCDWSRAPGSGEAAEALCLFGQEVKEQAAVPKDICAHTALLQAMHDKLPLVAWWIDAKGIFKYLGGQGLTRGGIDPAKLLGSSIFEMYPAELVGYIRKALAGRPTSYHNEAHGIVWENWAVPLADAEGNIVGAVGCSVDVTALYRAEQQVREKLAVIERQQSAIQALSTPIIQVWEGVLTLPMIGVVESTRAAAVMDDLLDAVARTQSRFAILDLTGVDAVDTRTAAYLLDLIRAVRLLGAEGVVTGIRPSVAQTIVGLGVDLGSILTLGNLQAALRHCIAAMQRGATGERAARAPLGRGGWLQG